MKSGSVLTLGTFDGVHRGHQSLLKKVLSYSRELNLKSIALTFSQPPRLYFSPSSEPYLLSTVEEKKVLLKNEGIDKVVILNFNRSLSLMTAKVFFEDFILKKYRARAIILGYNFCFGKDRQGDISFLKNEAGKAGINVDRIPPLKAGKLPISSGRIRNALKEGNLSLANTLLGHPYLAIGKVIKGSGIGKSFGFPTANLEVDPLKILPLGVFAVKVTHPHWKNPLVGMCNVGVRPTLRSEKEIRDVKEIRDGALFVRANRAPSLISFEVHLLNFKGDLYGQSLSVQFIKKLRAEKKFNSLQELKVQLNKDREQTLLVS